MFNSYKKYLPPKYKVQIITQKRVRGGEEDIYILLP
jgi:hypothetical protein